MKGVKGEEIILATENKPGKLEEVTKGIQEKGINIRAINAYVVEDRALFRLITSDTARAREVLNDFGTVESKEVVIAEMPDEVGRLHSLALCLKEAGIDLAYIYGTTSQPQAPALIVFSSNNNDKALEVISS